MGEYESKLEEGGKLFPAPKHHRVNMDGYLRSYLYNPALYLLSVARAKQMVEAHCGPEDTQEVRLRKSCGGQKEATSNTRDGQTNTQKVKTDIWATMTTNWKTLAFQSIMNSMCFLCRPDAAANRPGFDL